MVEVEGLVFRLEEIYSSVSAVVIRDVRSIQMGVPDARKTDRSELQNTLEGTEHGKGAESVERNEERGEMRNIYRKG